jgi:hypothetical protein
MEARIHRGDSFIANIKWHLILAPKRTPLPAWIISSRGHCERVSGRRTPSWCDHVIWAPRSYNPALFPIHIWTDMDLYGCICSKRSYIGPKLLAVMQTKDKLFCPWH